ncbi:hypothetical protein MMF93_28040 [Streptomyces tubbatahanensis]|uniref:Uncharacterized protein n=1 Tax=Streptomyces tubbatahanensis TaxID=2923272 RepID=A0ABY3XZQ8_9ACTN|nr:hypothetical protein [Streptomyces tubbatahanensis]UNS99875.1 hypothetical protein MMF93_28040 [Streptomyces tubbatahanensis]
MDGPARAEPDRRSAGAAFAQVRAVADAICYEGYLLYPYRRSSPKNRVRWQFGILAPRAWVEADGPVPPSVAGAAESWRQHTACLVEADPGALLRVRVRYLQVQGKRVERRVRTRGGGGEDAWEAVESADLGGELHLSFDEAVEHETDIEVELADLIAGERTFPVGAPGGTKTTEPAGAGALAGADGEALRVVRYRRPLAARTTLSAHPLADRPGAHRLSVRTENTDDTVPAGTPRDEALRHSLIATHTLLGGEGVAYVSLIDPPAWAAAHTDTCRNLHTFPVLAGEEGTRRMMLSSPILLSDHPQVAPESPGDLHDAAEIDEILSLRTFLLTDEEKREARATDARAAAILDQVENMPREVFARLHGAIRSLEPAGDSSARTSAATTPAAAEPPPDGNGPGPARATTPWWQEGGDEGISPSTDSVLVAGVPVRRGHRVVLRPRARGADAHDIFLAGRTAQIAGVFHDVDGSVHLAVTLDDDPAAEVNAWYGRYFYFRTDEVHPLDADASAPDADASASDADASAPDAGARRGPDEKRSDGRHRTVEA